MNISFRVILPFLLFQNSLHASLQKKAIAEFSIQKTVESHRSNLKQQIASIQIEKADSDQLREKISLTEKLLVSYSLSAEAISSLVEQLEQTKNLNIFCKKYRQKLETKIVFYKTEYAQSHNEGLLKNASQLEAEVKEMSFYSQVCTKGYKKLLKKVRRIKSGDLVLL